MWVDYISIKYILFGKEFDGWECQKISFVGWVLMDTISFLGQVLMVKISFLGRVLMAIFPFGKDFAGQNIKKFPFWDEFWWGKFPFWESFPRSEFPFWKIFQQLKCRKMSLFRKFPTVRVSFLGNFLMAEMSKIFLFWKVSHGLDFLFWKFFYCENAKNFLVRKLTDRMEVSFFGLFQEFSAIKNFLFRKLTGGMEVSFSGIVNIWKFQKRKFWWLQMSHNFQIRKYFDGWNIKMCN